MSGFFPSIPGINDLKRCVLKIKEAMEIGLGYTGPKNKEGRNLDEWVTYRNLEKLLLTSEFIANAVTEVTIGSFRFNDPIDTGIVSDIITLTGSGMVTAFSESGVIDDLSKINGLLKGDTIYLLAAAGHTITLTASAYLKLPSPTWALSGYRIATFDCVGAGICVMRSHEANRT